jgi:hypothetical protein
MQSMGINIKKIYFKVCVNNNKYINKNKCIQLNINMYIYNIKYF